MRRATPCRSGVAFGQTLQAQYRGARRHTAADSLVRSTSAVGRLANSFFLLGPAERALTLLKREARVVCKIRPKREVVDCCPEARKGASFRCDGRAIPTITERTESSPTACRRRALPRVGEWASDVGESGADEFNRPGSNLERLQRLAHEQLLGLESARRESLFMVVAEERLENMAV